MVIDKSQQWMYAGASLIELWFQDLSSIAFLYSIFLNVCQVVRAVAEVDCTWLQDRKDILRKLEKEERSW
jgi:hypothetical protein